MDRITLVSICTENNLTPLRYEIRYLFKGRSSGFNTADLDMLLLGASSFINSDVADTSKKLEFELNGKFSKDAIEKIDDIFYNFSKSKNIGIRYLRNYTLL